MMMARVQRGVGGHERHHDFTGPYPNRECPARHRCATGRAMADLWLARDGSSKLPGFLPRTSQPWQRGRMHFEKETAVTTLANQRSIQVTHERWFFATMAGVVAITTFVGFAPSYYLAPMFGGRPLSSLLHVHGFVFTGWILLYVAQTGLISVGRTDIHRILGTAGIALAVAMVPLGIATAIITKQFAAAHHLPPQGPPLVFPLGAILTFAALIVAAVAMRSRAAWHKRLMLLGTVAILTTPLARITRFAHLGLTPPIGGMLLTDIMLAALVTYDLKKYGRLHPATAWGGSFFLATQILRVLLNITPAWQHFARSLTG